MKNTIIGIIAAWVIGGCNSSQENENLSPIEQKGHAACQKIKDVLSHGTNPAKELDEYVNSNHSKWVVWRTFWEGWGTHISVWWDIGGFTPFPESHLKKWIQDKLWEILSEGNIHGCLYKWGKTTPLIYKRDYSYSDASSGNKKIKLY